MSWLEVATIPISQEWQQTSSIGSDLGYVRFSFSTSGIPFQIAQIDPDSGALFDQRRLVASGNSQIHLFECPPIFENRALALRLLLPTASFEINIEVSGMPVSRSSSLTAPTASAVTASTVAAATTSTSLLAANTSRKTASFTNTGSNVLYLELGATASATAYTVALAQGDMYELPVAYTGAVSGLWTSTNGGCLVREFV